MQINIYRGCYLKIDVNLNPLYEGYFPLNTGVYGSMLVDMWNKIRQVLSDVDRLMIVPDQGILVLTLIKSDKLADQV